MNSKHFKLLLKVAAFLAIFYGLGHMAGYPWTPATGESEIALVESMRSLRFEVFGFNRTYWDFYLGFGIGVGLLLILMGALLWQLASLVETNRKALRPLLITMLIAFGSNAALTWQYFFLPPLIFAVVISLLLAVAVARV